MYNKKNLTFWQFQEVFFSIFVCVWGWGHTSRVFVSLKSISKVIIVQYKGIKYCISIELVIIDEQLIYDINVPCRHFRLEYREGFGG